MDVDEHVTVPLAVYKTVTRALVHCFTVAVGWTTHSALFVLVGEGCTEGLGVACKLGTGLSTGPAPCGSSEVRV